MARQGEPIEVTAESFFQGIHVAPDTDKVISPEQGLWLSVVARVWGDAFLVSDTWLRNSDPTCEPDLVRSEARRWLVADYGDYAIDREWCCDLAGISPEFIQSQARRKLAQAKMAEAESRQAEVVAIDRAFSVLVETENAMDGATLDAALAALAQLEAAVA